MEEAGFTSQSALSRASGVPQPTINRILKNVGKGQPESGTVTKLAEACNVSFTWLNEGIGDKHRKPDRPLSESEKTAKSNGFKTRSVREVDPDTDETVSIRSVKLKLSAGISGYGVEQLSEREAGYPVILPRRWFEQYGLRVDDLVAVKVRGDSMEPTISDGDTVVINTASINLKDGKIFAVNFDGEAVVKRLVTDYGRWFLHSDNPDQRRYHRQECSTAECIVVGQVVFIQRSII